MTDGHEGALTDAAAAAEINSDGWRLLLGGANSTVAVTSLPTAVEVATTAIRVCGPDAAHLRLDLRADQVNLALRTPGSGQLGRLDATLAARISFALGELGLTTTPGGTGAAPPVQVMEIAIDALDIPAVLPFWRAALGYLEETRAIAEGQEVTLVDPRGQGPTLWFQQLDAPRPQRNRIHFDITVADDEAEVRVAAAVASGGRLISDEKARAFWVLADPEGNEVCICTWQDRD